MHENIFLIAGYGWSGSSAIVDLLSEYECNNNPGVEFRIVKDPYGVNDLYNSLINKGDPLNYDNAIRDFYWLAKKLNNRCGKLSIGLNYQKYFNNRFMECTTDYITQLVKFKYFSTWWMLDFRRSEIELLYKKLKNKFRLSDEEYMYFSNISANQFIELTNNYIDELINFLDLENKYQNIILDQAVSVLNITNEMKFFKNAKAIVVDRDPRDIYSDLCKSKSLIGRDRNASHYIEWHMGWRKNDPLMNCCDKIIRIRFEDLVLKHEETKKKIEDFLNIDAQMHTHIGEKFSPHISSNNIGIWKQFMSKEELEQFDNYLKHYYYDK